MLRSSSFAIRMIFLCAFSLYSSDLSAAVITGSVNDQETGEPLCSVLLWVRSLNRTLNWRVQTDSEGVYRVEGIESGFYHLEVILPGYADATFAVAVRNDDQVIPLSLLLAPKSSVDLSVSGKGDLLSTGRALYFADKGSRPDLEGDQTNDAMRLTAKPIPSGTMFRMQSAVGYNAAFLNRDFIGFRTDSIFADPLERFGSDYSVLPSDFPKDNVRLLYSTPPPDLSGEGTAAGRLMDGKFGLLFNVNAGQEYRVVEVDRNYEALDQDNQIYYTHREHRLDASRKNSLGLKAKGDYILGMQSRLFTSIQFTLQANQQARFLTDTNYTSSPTLSTKERTGLQEQNKINALFSGEHGFGSFRLKWHGGWTYTNGKTPDRAELTTLRAVINDSLISIPVFRDMIRDWQRNTDHDIAGAVDLAWKKNGTDTLTISAGGMGRIRTRRNSMNAYRLIPIPDPATGQIPGYSGLDNLEWNVANAQGSPDYSNNNYTASENVIATYGMGEFVRGRWDLLVGVRVEGTTAEYSTQDVNLFVPITAQKSYVDLLPSLNVRYSTGDFSHLTGSFGRSLQRPHYYDLVPYSYVSGEGIKQGNPALKRSVSTNVNIGYEYLLTPEMYPHFRTNLFAEWIENPVETVLDLSNASLPTFTPKNLGTALNYGMELSGELRLFSFLSLSGTYIYTHSTITTNKIRFNKDAGITEVIPETHSLMGQAEHEAQIALTVNDAGRRTVAQLNFGLVGNRVVQVSPFFGLDHIQTPFPTLDLQVSQKVGEHFTLFLEGSDLLNAPYEVELENESLVEYRKSGQHLQVGVAYQR